MVASVGSTDSWRIFARLSRGFKLVCADPSSGCCVASHGLEVKSQLTDVARQLADRCGAGAPSAGGSDTTGVARVPDVGVVGGEGGATGGGGDDTADPEACSTGPTGRPTPAGALRGAVAGPCRAGVSAARAVVIGELHDAEQRQLL